MFSKLLLSIFTWFSINNVFHSEEYCFPSRTDSYQWYFRVSNLIQHFQTDWFESSIQSSLVIQNSCYIEYLVSYHPYCKSVLYQLSSITIIYFIMGFKSFSPKFLVAMSANFRPPSHQSILWILKISPFLEYVLSFKCALCAYYTYHS